jgi:hypothetical protein
MITVINFATENDPLKKIITIIKIKPMEKQYPVFFLQEGDFS